MPALRPISTSADRVASARRSGPPSPARLPGKNTITQTTRGRTSPTRHPPTPQDIHGQQVRILRTTWCPAVNAGGPPNRATRKAPRVGRSAHCGQQRRCSSQPRGIVPYPNHAAFHLTFCIRPYSSSIRVNRQFFHGNRPVKGPVQRMARRSASDGELAANLDDPGGPPRGPEVDDHAAAPGAHAGQHELAVVC